MPTSNPFVQDLKAQAVLAEAAWDRYCERHQPTGSNGTEGFAETGLRLKLLKIIVGRILTVHDFLSETWDHEAPIDLNMVNLIEGDLRIDTETFYWQAGRIRHLVKSLPGLKAFEAPGVRNVRNHLIEHPEGKASLVLVASFGWSSELGPAIKPGRPVGSSLAFQDVGLFLNATEFYRALASQICASLE